MASEKKNISEEENVIYLDPENMEPDNGSDQGAEMAESAAVVKLPVKSSPHVGHRARMRKKFRESGGFDTFTDDEILEFILFYGKPRGDVHPVARELVQTFGSLKGVLEAKPDKLEKIKGLGESQITLITMILPLIKVWNRSVLKEGQQISNRETLEKYCLSFLAGERTERFLVICVDARCKLLGHRCISEGSLSEVSAYPRKVMETALDYNAYSVFFCHNHPGGTCAPSAEDVSSTLQLQRMLSNVGICVLDHIIVAGDKTYSMAQHGDIDFRIRSGKER